MISIMGRSPHLQSHLRDDQIVDNRAVLADEKHSGHCPRQYLPVGSTCKVNIVRPDHIEVKILVREQPKHPNQSACRLGVLTS